MVYERTYNKTPIAWVGEPPTIEEYDIDNPSFLSGGQYNECPCCGEPKQVRSKLCLRCYRESRKHDPHWRGSAAWRKTHGTAEESTDGSIPEGYIESFVDPAVKSEQEHIYSPTPLDRSLWSSV